MVLRICFLGMDLYDFVAFIANYENRLAFVTYLYFFRRWSVSSPRRRVGISVTDRCCYPGTALFVFVCLLYCIYIYDILSINLFFFTLCLGSSLQLIGHISTGVAISIIPTHTSVSIHSEVPHYCYRAFSSGKNSCFSEMPNSMGWRAG